MAAPALGASASPSALFAPIATAVVLAIVIGVWAIVDGVFDTVRYAFANALSERAKQLYETYAVPTPGKTLFQTGTANLNPANVATDNIRFGLASSLLMRL